MSTAATNSSHSATRIDLTPKSCCGSPSCCSSNAGNATPSDPALAAAALLEQAAALIASLSDAAYTAPSTRIAGGTIGKHFRHCLDHFAAALAPLTLGDGAIIDYDHRERNVPMESNRAQAIIEIRSVRDALLQTRHADLARPVTVRVMISCDGREAELPSTFGRELAFASHHAVHHHAMIRSIVEEFDHTVTPDFGKAPSTIHFQRFMPTT